MADPGALDAALERAYRHLGRRDRTVAELRRALLRAGFSDAVAGAAVQELSAQGYLDDRRFALAFAQDRRRLDGWGALRIGRRLRELGVGAPDADAALAALGDEPQDELEVALALLRRRFPAAPATDRDRNRALGLLIRRGFDLELAHEALRAAARERA